MQADNGINKLIAYIPNVMFLKDSLFLVCNSEGDINKNGQE